jgi:hypothetical protein
LRGLFLPLESLLVSKTVGGLRVLEGFRHARRIMSYDVRVYELVEHFLSAVPEKNTERNRHLPNSMKRVQSSSSAWIC